MKYESLSKVVKALKSRTDTELFILESIEKQVPVRAVEDDEKGGVCPECFSPVSMILEGNHVKEVTYCCYCGQGLDWSD